MNQILKTSCALKLLKKGLSQISGIGRESLLNKCVVLLILFTVTPLTVCEADTSFFVESDIPATHSFRHIDKHNVHVGEKFIFSVRFMGIPCGEVMISVDAKEKLRGRDVYVVQTRAYTNAIFSALYNVSDTLTSYIDSGGIFSWRYIKDIDEKKFNKYEVYDYDHVDKMWYKNKEYAGEIVEYTQDFISSLFYFRSVPWEDTTEEISVPLNDNRKNYDLILKLGRNKSKKTIFGWSDCRVGSPYLQLDGKYKQIGKSYVWFTDDNKRIPVLIKSRLLMGSFYAVLIKYEPGE